MSKCIFSVLVFNLLFGVHAHAETIYPVAGNDDGEFKETTLSGKKVFQNIGGDSFMYFDVPSWFEFTRGQRVFVRVDYHEAGTGTFDIQYDGVTSNFSVSEIEYHNARTGRDTFSSAYFALDNPDFANSLNGQTDFRIRLKAGGSTPMSIVKIDISNVNFTNNKTWLDVVAKPWIGAGDNFNRARSEIPTDDIQGQVVVGYQGWFRVPNDPDTGKWIHWVKNNTPTAANYSIDMWPYNEDYDFSDLTRAGAITTKSGKNAYLFSSAMYGIVDTHFKWMKDSRISGVFIQRFLSSSVLGAGHDPEFVLYNVMKAANKHGRTWTIEYDVSQFARKDESHLAYDTVTADWEFLVDQCGILNDESYLYQGSKPVVIIYGLATPNKDENGNLHTFTVAQADAIVNYFKSDPVYGGNFIIGAVPTDWRNLHANNNHHLRFENHYAKYDMISVWNPKEQDYVNDANRIEQIDSRIGYLPHTRPGFSWTHLKNIAAGSPEDPYFKREGGANLWDKLEILQPIAPAAIFVGMFDEYDEGTAVMPMADDHPPAHTDRRFLNNEGHDPFTWLKITGTMGQMLQGNLDATQGMPSPKELDEALANGVRNGSFEKGLQFWNADSTYSYSTTKVMDRSLSAKTTHTGITPQRIWQEVLVEHGATYRFKAKVYKENTDGKVVVDMGDVPGEVQVVIGSGYGAGWTTVDDLFVNSANVDTVKVRMFVRDNPTAPIYLDAVSLEKIDKSKELVVNGNFERIDASKLVGWNLSSYNEFTSSFAKKGTGALMSRADGVAHSASQIIYVDPHTEYKVSGYIYKGSNVGNAYYDMSDIDGELTLQINGTGGGKWNFLEGNWNSESTTYIKLRVVAGNSLAEDVYFDKVSVVGEKSENLLKNGSFESLDGWTVHPNHSQVSSAQMGDKALEVAATAAATKQTVIVEKNTTYRLRAWIYKKNSAGVAYVDMSDIPGELSLVSPDGEGGGEWTYFEDTWNSGSNTSLTIRCVGGGNLTDVARFDGLSLEKVRKVSL